MIQISYDEEVGTLYLKLSEKQIARTVEVKKNVLLLDLDNEGQVVGVEILDLNVAIQYLGPIIKQYDIDKSRIKKELERIQYIEPAFA